MKKTLLFFGFALLGLMFFACQKDEPVHEQSALDSSEVVSVERSINCAPCIDAGGCCCRLVSLQGFQNNHDVQLCYLGTIFEIPNPYGTMDNVTFSPPCTIPSTSCNQDPFEVPYYQFEFPNDLPPNPTANTNPYYPHGFFAGFCSQPNNLFQICNLESYVVNMTFSCILDTDWREFELQPNECKVFRINNCQIVACD